jgi:hypothetical protein
MFRDARIVKNVKVADNIEGMSRTGTCASPSALSRIW